MMNPYLVFILFFVSTIFVSHAQDTPDLSMPPSYVPTTVATSSEPSFQPSQRSPSTAPTDECTNDPDWYYNCYECSYIPQKLRCDDDRVYCWNYGNLGMAQSYCCKCKSQCSGQCTDVPTSSPTSSNDDYYTYRQNEDDGSLESLAAGVFFILLVCSAFACKALNNEGQHNARREANRQTMVARRQQQRQNNSEGLTEEERSHARYELFVTKFHFQKVLPDKSNIYASSLRNATANPDEEHRNEDKSNDDDALAAPKETPSKRSLSERFSKASLSIRQLSSWRRTSTEDECCICLGCYNVGETICAAITKECDHVYHEGCMLQWFKNNDKCPLCRVDLLKD